MKLIQKIAGKLAKETGYSKEILAYPLIIIGNTVVGYGFLIMTASLMGWLEVALAVAVTYSLFRIVSGGAHASSNLRCVVIGTLIFNVLAFVSLSISSLFQADIMPMIILFAFTLSLLAFYFYAPADVPEKPITSRKQRLSLKVTVIVLLVVWLLLGLILAKGIKTDLILASILGLLWQSVSITPLGYKIMGLLDNCLRKHNKSDMI